MNAHVPCGTRLFQGLSVAGLLALSACNTSGWHHAAGAASDSYYQSSLARQGIYVPSYSYGAPIVRCRTYQIGYGENTTCYTY